METLDKFLTTLYSYEYFSTYLIVSIIVLVILFIVILFCGKKDQKEREIEATKKLIKINEEQVKEQIGSDQVKEVNNEMVNVNNLESNPVQNVSVSEPDLNDTIIVPNISDINVSEIPSNNNEVKEDVLPVININELDNNDVIEPVSEQSVNTFKEENNINKVEFEPVKVPDFNFETLNEDTNKAIFEKEEEKPFEFPSFESPIEEVKVENNDVLKDVPAFNFDDILNSANEVSKEELPKEAFTKGPEIFSSVYVPKKEEVVEENNSSDDLDIELPTLKKEVNNDNMDIPKLNDYNLDNISGESYNIK